jgi:hypothetical protein
LLYITGPLKRRRAKGCSRKPVGFKSWTRWVNPKHAKILEKINDLALAKSFGMEYYRNARKPNSKGDSTMAMLVKLGILTSAEAANLNDLQVSTLVDEVQFELIQNALIDAKVQAHLKGTVGESVKSLRTTT